jgi:transcriptional regulator with XRE-family HTH domain
VSPFAKTLRALRLHRGIRQKELAERLGYEQSYVSALEMGSKGPPTDRFVSRLAEVLHLSGTELIAIRNAVRDSQRRYSLPPSARPNLFELCSELWRELPHLSESQIRVIREVIKMNDAPRPGGPIESTVRENIEEDIQM